MKEQLISFETAKLAKEKGFDEKSYNWYRDFEKTLYGRNAKRGGLIPPIKQGIGINLAPSQSILQKWLREKHYINIHLFSMHFNFCVYWNFSIYDLKEGMNEDISKYCLYDGESKIFDFDNISKFNSYESALEAGLQEALKLIK